MTAAWTPVSPFAMVMQGDRCRCRPGQVLWPTATRRPVSGVRQRKAGALLVAVERAEERHTLNYERRMTNDEFRSVLDSSSVIRHFLKENCEQENSIQWYSADGQHSFGQLSGGDSPNWAARQAEKVNYFCVVDLQPDRAARSGTATLETRSLAAVLLACGASIRKRAPSLSRVVAAHAEGCWPFNCITPLGWLQRMTQFRINRPGRRAC